MNLDELRESIRGLAVLVETDTPILSCYINLEGRTRSYRLALDERALSGPQRGCPWSTWMS